MSALDDREPDRRVGKLPQSTIHPATSFRYRAPNHVAESALGLCAVRGRGHRAASVCAWPRRSACLRWSRASSIAVAFAGALGGGRDELTRLAPGRPWWTLENVKERMAYRAAVSVLEATLAEIVRTCRAMPQRGRAESWHSRPRRSHGASAARDPESVDLRSQLLDEYQQDRRAHGGRRPRHEDLMKRSFALVSLIGAPALMTPLLVPAQAAPTRSVRPPMAFLEPPSPPPPPPPVLPPPAAPAAAGAAAPPGLPPPCRPRPRRPSYRRRLEGPVNETRPARPPASSTSTSTTYGKVVVGTKRR
jgi:hypothetical protein